MKKLLLSFFFLILLMPFALAKCGYVNFCPPQTSNTPLTFGQKISKRTGATLLSEKIAQMRVRKELKKATGQNFKVVIKTYSLMDLFNGRFKSITITGKNLDIEGAYLTSIELKTLCDFNHVDFGRNTIRFKENMIMSFNAVISNTDLMKTMQSSGYLDRLNCVNVHGCGITFFKLSGADIKLKNNKLCFRVKVTSQLLLEKPIEIVLDTELKAENGRIIMTKVNLAPTKIDLSKVANRIDQMNPLAFSLNVFENKNAKMCIQNVKIVEDKIYITGNVFIPKNEPQAKTVKKQKKLFF